MLSSHLFFFYPFGKTRSEYDAYLKHHRPPSASYMVAFSLLYSLQSNGSESLMAGCTLFSPLPNSSSSKANALNGEGWSSLVRGTSKVRQLMTFYTLVVEDGVVDVLIEIKDKGNNFWADYLIRYCVGGKLPFHLVHDMIEKQWRTKLKSMSLHHDFFFKFNTREERQIALEQYVLHIAEKLFIVKPWSVQVEEENKNVWTIPVWVNFDCVSKSLWFDEGLAFVPSSSGNRWCLDEATTSKERLNLTRVCGDQYRISVPPKLWNSSSRAGS